MLWTVLKYMAMIIGILTIIILVVDLATEVVLFAKAILYGGTDTGGVFRCVGIIYSR